jgi:hypothetical protein
VSVKPKRQVETLDGRHGQPFTHDATDTPVHTLLRPSWLCRGCGEPWPCEPKRCQLIAESIESPAGLRMLMASMLSDAAGDLPDVPADELGERFLGWVRAGLAAGRTHRRPDDDHQQGVITNCGQA